MRNADRMAALLPRIDDHLQNLARDTSELLALVRDETRARWSPNDRANQAENFANALDAERIANAIVGRMRHLGLGWVLDLASTTGSRGSEWVTELTRVILATVGDDGPSGAAPRDSTSGAREGVAVPVKLFVEYCAQKGINPDLLAQQLTGRPHALQDARAAGVDLLIPAANDAVTGFVAKELGLVPHDIGAESN